MLTRLGEMRAYVNIFFSGKLPRQETVDAYRRYYRSWQQRGFSPDALTNRSSAEWARAAVRWGVHERLRDLVNDLEKLVVDGRDVSEADLLLAGSHGRYTLSERAKWGVQEDGRRMVRVTSIATRLVREAGHPLHLSEIVAAGVPEFALRANPDLVRRGSGLWGLPGMPVTDEHLEDEVYIERMRAAGGPFSRGDLARIGLTVGRRRRFLTQGWLMPDAEGRWRFCDRCDTC